MALDLGTLVAKLRVDNDMGRGLAEGRRSIDRFTRDAGGRLNGLRNQFRDLGRGLGRGVGDGVDEGSRRGLGQLGERLRGLGDSLGDLAKKGVKGVGDLGAAMGKLAKENPQLVIGGLVGALGALPLVAGIASSALTVGLGGAIAMVGIRAAATSKRVQDAFSDLRSDLQAGLRDAAAPFEGSLVRMIATARKELAGLAGPVRAAFSNLAPALEKAFGSVARAVGSLGPTLAYISQQAGPLVEVLGRELGILVKGLAADFSRLAGAADPRFLTVMVGAFRGLSAILTEVIVRASQFGSAILDLIDKLPFVDFKKPATDAKGLGDAFKLTSAGAREVSEAVEQAQQSLAEFYDPSIAVFNATTNLRSSFKDLRKALLESKGSMEGTSDAALTARGSFASALDSVRDMYQAQLNNGAGHDKARAAIARQLQVLEKLAGDNKSAKKQVDALKKSLDALKSKTITVTVNARGPGAGTANALQRFKDIPGMATGGLVTGPGGPTSDDVPAMLSRGEYVLPAAVVQRVGVRRLEALRRGKGNPPGLGDLRRDTLGDLTRGGGGELGKLVRNPGQGDLDLKKQIDQQIKTLKAGLKKIREAREDLLEDLSSASADSVKNAARSLSKMVKEAFAGFAATTTVDNRLLAQIGSTSKRLQTLADQRAALAERLQEALAFAAATTERAQGFASVLTISVVDEDGNPVDPNASELKTGLAARLDALRKFGANMRQLANQGLSKTMLRQLWEQGPDQAGGLAEAIVAGGQQAVDELTHLQDEIDREAKALGEFGADHLYDAGARAGEGFLTGLTGQLATLEATMENLANNLITTVTNAIAAAQKIAQEQAAKIKEKEKANGGGGGGGGQLGDLVRGPGEGNKLGDSVRDPKGGGKGGNDLAPLKRSASGLNITNYYESNKGSAHSTAAALILLSKGRG